MRARLGWIVLVVLLLVGGATLLVRTRAEPEAPVPADARRVPTLPGRLPIAAAPSPRLTTPAPAAAPAPPAAGAQPEPVVDPGYPVNLEALRARIPRNLYWSNEAPTNDPDEIRRRDGEAATWNVLQGKVLSGTASDVDLRTWFEHRRRVSEDAIEFAGQVLAEHGAELPERDRGLLELALDMHRTRLAELPRDEAEARARKAEQDRRRAEWRSRPTP